MDNGNVGPGQMMGQWNNFEARQYNPNRHNLDPLMNQESMEAGVEQRVEQLPNNMNLVNQGPPNAYDNANMMGNAGLTATGFLSSEEAPQAPLGEVVTVGNMTFDDKGKIVGTDLPKAKDMDGLEPEFIKAVIEAMKIKDPNEKYRKMRELVDKLLLDRYGRVIGQGNE